MKLVPTSSLLLPQSDIYLAAELSSGTFYDRITAGVADNDMDRLSYMFIHDYIRVLIRPEHAKNLPEELSFLLTADSLLSMGFCNFDGRSMPAVLELAKNFCRYGVLLPLPGTTVLSTPPYVLRRFLPMFAVLEPTGNHYNPVLPASWKEAITTPHSDDETLAPQ